jgi:hypothetical protein
MFDGSWQTPMRFFARMGRDCRRTVGDKPAQAWSGIRGREARPGVPSVLGRVVLFERLGG